VLGGGSVGFGVGSLGVGGGGAVTSSTVRVGEGKAGVFRLLELSFALSLIFGSTTAFGFSVGEGDSARFAFTF
jgi:hypothetical protein